MVVTPATKKVAEVTGIVPDVVVKIASTDLQAGRLREPGKPEHDLVLSAALDYLDSDG
jgi:hypothetical protein